MKRFIKDQSGAIAVDMVGLTGAAVLLGVGAVEMVSRGVESSADDVRTKTAAISAGQTYGGLSWYNTRSGASGGEGNPGNDKAVGKAGENPNGKGGWGTGSKGKSE